MTLVFRHCSQERTVRGSPCLRGTLGEQCGERERAEDPARGCVGRERRTPSPPGGHLLQNYTPLTCLRLAVSSGGWSTLGTSPGLPTRAGSLQLACSCHVRASLCTWEQVRQELTWHLPGAQGQQRSGEGAWAALPADIALGATLGDLQTLVIVDGPLLSGCAARLNQVLRGDCG